MKIADDVVSWEFWSDYICKECCNKLCAACMIFSLHSHLGVNSVYTHFPDSELCHSCKSAIIANCILQRMGV
jgi:hypothetical protein